MQMRETDDEIYRTLYRNQKVPLPKNYVAKNDIESPKLPPDVLRVEQRQVGYNYVDQPESTIERTTRQMQAMTGIDRMVGQVREKLRRIGADRNTIIIFTSDHGLFMGEQGLGGKALCYEKTTHVPLIVFDPASPPQSRGRRCDQFAQSIDIASTMLDYAGIDLPETCQGKSIRSLIGGSEDAVHDYIFTENLWSTHFGNPRIEAVQNKDWKYIRYYKNENVPASLKISVAKELGIPVNKILYYVGDSQLAVYRQFVESSLAGEAPVYEELYDMRRDPNELHNVIDDVAHEEVLAEMKTAWKKKLTVARGVGAPKVLRYTAQSKLERELHATGQQ